jgi:hypothetical protein
MTGFIQLIKEFEIDHYGKIFTFKHNTQAKYGKEKPLTYPNEEKCCNLMVEFFHIYFLYCPHVRRNSLTNNVAIQV